MIFKTLPALNQSLLKTIFLTVLLGISVGSMAQAPPYLFANRVGNTDYEIAEDMAIDASGNVYVVGNYASASVTFGSITVTNSTPGNRRFFLAKYDASGTCLWVRTSTTSGTFGSELGYGVTVDGSGNVLATGSFSATNVSFGSVTLTNHNAGYADMFVVKYDASGTAQWAASAGGSRIDQGKGVATDASGNVYVTGTFASQNIEFGLGSGNLSFNAVAVTSPPADIFLAAYDASGVLQWQQTFGGTASDNATSICADASGNMTFTGYFSSTSIDFGSTTLNLTGNSDLFTAQFDGTGAFNWAKDINGSTSGSYTAFYSYDIAADASGNLYIVGDFGTFPVTFGSSSLTNTGFSNFFLAKYNSSGTEQWAKTATIPSGAYAPANKVTTDASGNVIVGGSFLGASIDLGTGSINNTAASFYDMLTAKFNSSGTTLWVKTDGSSNTESVTAVAANAAGQTYVAGTFYSPTLTLGSTTLTNADNTTSSSDIFISKLDVPSSCTAPNGTVAFGAFSGVTTSATTTNVTYTNGSNAATGYVLLRNTTNTAPTAPASGTAVPTAGSTSFVSGYTVVNTTTTIGSSVAFSSTGLSSGTTYYYWVVAYQNTNGPCWFTPATQANNSQATTTPPACIVPNGTVSFSAFSGVSTSATTTNVTYTNGSNAATGYALLRNTTNTAPTAPASGTAVPAAGSTTFVSGYTVVDTTTTIGSSVAFNSTGLISGTTYYYWVVAYQNTNGPCWFTPATQAANSQATTIGSATALNFDGSDDVVQISNSSVFNMSSGTIEAWFKTSNAGSGFRAIVVKEQYYCLFLLDNKICVFDWSGGGGFLSGGTYHDNNWHHVAFVFNYGVTNGSKVFIDGVAQAAFTYNQGTAITSTLAIGNSPGNPQNFNGTIDEVRIWNKALCDGDIINQRNCELGGTLSSDLLAYYKFNQGNDAGNNTAITTLTDATGSYPGTLSGFALTGSTSNFISGGSTPTGNTCSYAPLSASATNTGPYCAGATISVSSTPSGGTATYTYSWSSSAGGAYTATGSPATRTSSTTAMSGAYDVTVTDANSCTTTATTSVTVNANPTVPTVTANETSGTANDGIICNGAGVTLSGPAGATTYAWSNSGGSSQTSSSFSPTTNTTYSLTVTNSSTCSASANYTVTVNSNPSTPTISTTAATCSAAGTATITNYNGSLTYTFAPSGPSAGAGGVISGMTAATSYTVTAGNGTCTSASSSSFSIAAQLTVPATPTVNTTAATCSAAGTATITNYNGSLTYTFSPIGPSAGAGGVISGLVAATSYTVTAGNGSCSSTASSSFSVAAQLTVPATPTISTTAATCSAAGTATITNYNGSLTYTFAPSGPSAGAGGVISGMTAATSYTVTAGNGTCTSASSSSFSIAAQLTVPATPAVNTTAATCSAAGTATITNYNGSLTYTFSPIGPSAGAGGVISGLVAATSYTVTAGNGSCSSTASSSFSVAAQLTVPATPTISTTAATCSAAGTATITNYNGSLTYTFAPSGPSAGAGGVISGMTAATSYTVTAGNGTCTSASSSSFSIAAQLTVPATPTVNTTAATCSAAGTATITNYNGSLTYTFSPIGPSAGAGGVISGLVAATSYTVTAGNGSCSSTASSSFSVAAQLTVPATPTISTTAATCSAAGTATITNYNGSLTYTFAPSGPSAGAGGVISGMTAATSYTVTAGNGTCTSASSSSFSIAAQLTVPATPTVNTTAATCSAAGTATITNYNGSLTYTFSPIGPSAGAGGVISGLVAATSYTVTAGNGSCSSTASSSFSVAAQLTTPTATAPANQTYCTGVATSAIPLTGTPSGVTYDIAGGASVGLADQTGVTSIPGFTPNAAGTATINITPQANGCTGTAVSFTITVSNGSSVTAANTTATLDPDWPQANDKIYAIVRSGNTVYIGGKFTQVGGEPRSNIAAIDATTGQLTNWNPGANGEVRTLAVSGNTVYAGGMFTDMGGLSRNKLAAINATTGSIINTWNPGVSGIGDVRTLVVSGGIVYAGGSFTNIGGQPRNYIAAIDEANGTVTNWNPNALAPVYALAISGNTIYACGDFILMNGLPRNRIAAIDATSATPTAWNPGANNVVYALAVDGSTIYAGGDFTTIGGQPRNRIAALDATINTNNATAWNPNANAFVRSIAVSGSTVYAAGDFTSIAGQPRNYVAALDATITTNNATAWNPNADMALRAIAASGSTVYAGGDFTTIAGQPRNNFAVINNAGVTCVNTALNAISHTTTGATGIGAATGLPAGVNATWASNTITISGTPTVQGTFNYNIPLAGCGSVTATGAIIVNPAPLAPQVTPVPYCQNETATPLNATGTNLLWYTNSTGGTGSSAAPTPITSASGTISYYVSQTVNGCESPRAQLNVVVSDTPVISPNLGVACANGTSVVLNSNIGLSSVSVPQSGTLTLAPNGTTLTFTPGLPGQVLITVVSLASCSGSSVVNVSAPPTLSANLTNVTTFGGNNGAIDLTVTGGVTPYTFTWSNSATTEDITGLIAGTYTVTVTSGTCIATASYTVSQPNCSFTIKETGNLTSFCGADSLKFIVDPPNANVVWSVTNTSVFTISTQGVVKRINPNALDEYGLFVTATVNGCAVTTAQNPQYYYYPTLQDFELNLCEGQANTQLSALRVLQPFSTAQADIDFLNSLNINEVDNQITLTPKPLNEFSNSGKVAWTVPQSTQGCKVGVTLNISASPKVELPEVTTGCAGTPVSIAPKVTFVDLPIQSGFNPVQITNVWSDGSIGGELITSAAGSYTLTVSSYQIVNGSDITCSVEDATFIQFAPDYNLTATASNSSPNIGDNITLTATVDLPSGAFANVSYLWEAGLPTENIVDFPTNFWTKLTFMANDIFTVTSDVDGCKKSATIKLEAAPTAQNCLPIGFSPTNGDGVNDIYEAKDACNQEIGEWCITNLEAADVACGRGAVNWDGKHFQTQVLCPRGQYICYIKSIVENGELVKLQKPLSSTFDLN